MHQEHSTHVLAVLALWASCLVGVGSAHEAVGRIAVLRIERCGDRLISYQNVGQTDQPVAVYALDCSNHLVAWRDADRYGQLELLLGVDLWGRLGLGVGAGRIDQLDVVVVGCEGLGSVHPLGL